MIRNIKIRIARLENSLNPPKIKPIRWVRTFSYQYGLGGEAVREETDEQAIARHLADHPDDSGAEFNIINRVVVSPDRQHGDGNA